MSAGQPQKSDILTEDAIFSAIANITSTILGIPAAQIRIEDNFMKDLAADSLAMLNLRIAFEKHFGVKVPDDSLHCLMTVHGAVRFFVKSASEKHVL